MDEFSSILEMTRDQSTQKEQDEVKLISRVHNISITQ